MLFLVVLVPSAAPLVALGIWLLDQDRRLLDQRRQEQREALADAVARSLNQIVAEVRRTGDFSRWPGTGFVATMTADTVEVRPEGRLIWTPAPPVGVEADARLLVNAELAEFRKTGDRGLGTYQNLSRSPDPAVRAAALVRLARLRRTTQRIDAALETYASLAQLSTVRFDGMPADLLARRATCDLLDQAGRVDALAGCASALASDLAAGRWELDASAWRLSADQVEQWIGQPLAVVPDAAAAAAAVDWLWQSRHAKSGATFPPSGHHTLSSSDGTAAVLWTTTEEQVDAVVVTQRVATAWLEAATQGDGGLAASVALTSDADGRLAFAGQVPPETTSVSRLPTSDSGLPWTIVVAQLADGATGREFARRRMLLGAGLLAIVLLLSGGGALLWRLVDRELEVARLHADFVAGLSHEFRTPLTSRRDRAVDHGWHYWAWSAARALSLPFESGRRVGRRPT